MARQANAEQYFIPIKRRRIASLLSVIDLGKLVFYCAYGLWLSTIIISTSNFAAYQHYNIMRYVSFGLLLLSELLNGRYTRQTFYQCCAVVLVAVVAFRTGMDLLLESALFIFCARTISFRKIAKFSLFVSSLWLLAIIMASQLGIIANYIEYASFRTREYLGFRYSLYSSRLAFTITCLYVYIKAGRISFVEVVALMGFNWLLFEKTGSRLSFTLAVTLLVLTLLLKISSSNIIGRKSTGRLVSMVFISLFIACLVLVSIYNPSNTFLTGIDDGRYLGGRIAMGHSALENYGISLFGQDLPIVGNGLDINGNRSITGSYFYLDCLYIALPIRFGILFSVLFIWGMTSVTWHAWDGENYYLVLILVLIALHCVIEDSSLWLHFNPFLFLLANADSGAW